MVGRHYGVRRSVTDKVKPVIQVIHSGVAKVSRQLPGGVMIHHDVKTSLDSRGIKWVSIRDICVICGINPPERVDPDDIIQPIYFSETDDERAAVSLTFLSIFFDRLGYNRKYRFYVFNAVLEYWHDWFSKESRSSHPMHEAYAHVLNNCVEPAIDVFLSRFEEVTRQCRPEGLTTLVVYTMIYPRLLECIGQTQHVDFEDLTLCEISRLISVLSTFSLAALTAARDYEGFTDDPVRALINILRTSVFDPLRSYNEACSVMEDIVEECYDPEGEYKGVNELSYR